MSRAEELESQYQLDLEERRKEEERQKEEEQQRALQQEEETQPAVEESEGLKDTTTHLAAVESTAIASPDEDDITTTSTNRQTEQRGNLPIRDEELKSHHDAIASALQEVETILDDAVPNGNNQALLTDRRDISSPLSDSYSGNNVGGEHQQSPPYHSPIADSFAKQRSSDWFTDYPASARLGDQNRYSQSTEPEGQQKGDKRQSFQPIVNPRFLDAHDKLSDRSGASRSSLEQQAAVLSPPREGPNGYTKPNNEVKKNNASLEDDEDSDDNKENVFAPRPPPKDEKWVISSIRRPQQVPIRAAKGSKYEDMGSPVSEQASLDQSFSTSIYSELQENRPLSYSQANDSHNMNGFSADERHADNGNLPESDYDLAQSPQSKQQPNLKIAIPEQKRQNANSYPVSALDSSVMDSANGPMQMTSPDSEATSAARDSMMRMFGRDSSLPGQQQQQQQHHQQMQPQQQLQQQQQPFSPPGALSQPPSNLDLNGNQNNRMEGQTMGIRAPPWQQKGDRPNSLNHDGSEQPMSQYLNGYEQQGDEQTNGGMKNNINRMSSVSGPRMPNQNLAKGSQLPPSELLTMQLQPGQQQGRPEWGPQDSYQQRDSFQGRDPLALTPRENMYGPNNNNYQYNEGPEPGSKAGNKGGAFDFASKMKSALKTPSSADRQWSENGNMNPAMQDKAFQRSSLPAEKTTTNKESKGGRFSLAIFGKKDKDSKKNKEERGDYPISGSSSLGRAGGNQFVSQPRQDSLSFPVSNSNYSMNNEMTPPSWQQDPRRNQFNDNREPARPQFQQQASAASQAPPAAQAPPENQGDMKLEDGTPVLEYARALWSYNAKVRDKRSRIVCTMKSIADINHFLRSKLKCPSKLVMSWRSFRSKMMAGGWRNLWITGTLQRH